MAWAGCGGLPRAQRLSRPPLVCPLEMGVQSPGAGWICACEKITFNSQFVMQMAHVIVQIHVTAGLPSPGMLQRPPTPALTHHPQAVAEAGQVPTHTLPTGDAGKSAAPGPHGADYRRARATRQESRLPVGREVAGGRTLITSFALQASPA